VVDGLHQAALPHSLVQVYRAVEAALLDAYLAEQLLLHLQARMIASGEIADAQTAAVCIAEAGSKLVDGASSMPNTMHNTRAT